ncbi:MAG: SPFH/Band 7/PHB domain protein [Thermotogae bacterium]|nr:SPFH/Band 7/PHB domain protein [Thermotogota bacterium]
MIIPIIIAVFLIIIVGSSQKIVNNYERGLVERLGKYLKDVGPGLNFIVPFIDKLVKVDMREKVIDVPPQEVITKDNVGVTVDAVIYYQVTDPFKVTYNVDNFTVASVKLAQTNLRNVIGDLELDETLTSRERINTRLRQILDEATDKWGVKVTRVEIKKIDPPSDIMEAMSRQMKAERIKRAVILESEGYKQSEILKAEGDKTANILQAEGRAESIKRVADAERYKLITEAEGESNAIINVYTAIHKGNPTKDLISIKYMESLKEIANGKASKVFMPYEVSGILSSLASMVEVTKFSDNKEETESTSEKGE